MTFKKFFGIHITRILLLASICLLLPAPLPAVGFYTISGQVTDSGGRGVDGITVSFDDGSVPEVALTSGGGFYSHSVYIGWQGTVTPNDSCYAFTPSSVMVGPVNSNIIRDFTAVQHQYTVSGTITGSTGAVSNVLLTLSTGGSTLTAGDGTYAFSVPCGWGGTVTPAKTGWTFDPADRVYADVTANMAGQDFTGTAVITRYKIAGTVTVNGSPLEKAVMNGLPGSPVTDRQGAYSAKVPKGWSGTVTPALKGYIFRPENRSYADVRENAENEDYRALANDPPAVKIIQPPDQSIVSGTVTITAEASGTYGIDTVELFLNDQKVTEFQNISSQLTEVDPRDLERLFQNRYPPVQADGFGHTYAVIPGEKGLLSLVRQKNPSETDILLAEKMILSGWLVKPDGQVLIAGVTPDTGSSWVRCINSHREIYNTLDHPADFRWRLEPSDTSPKDLDFGPLVTDPSRTVFSCSYDWDTTGAARAPHVVRAVARDREGLTGEDEIQLTVSSIRLQMALEKKQEKAWIITRHYIKIDTVVENPDAVPIETFVILRQTPDGEFITIGEVDPAGITGNAFTFLDKYVAENGTHTYMIRALDINGMAVGTSEVTSVE